jgi:hypothetical protein
LENRRTIGITFGREVNAADPGGDLAALWPTVKWWLCLPVADLAAEHDWMVLECATNGEGAKGVVASAETLAELPPGLAYKVAVMRTFNYVPTFSRTRQAGGLGLTLRRNRIVDHLHIFS